MEFFCFSSVVGSPFDSLKVDLENFLLVVPNSLEVNIYLLPPLFTLLAVAWDSTKIDIFLNGGSTLVA